MMVRRGDVRRAREKGDANEDRVRAALMRPRRPWWLIEARRASGAEDHRGIDVVVETVDRGRLRLQVKSSPRGAEKWRRTHREEIGYVGMVIVNEGDCANTIYGKALGALILLRERGVDGGA